MNEALALLRDRETRTAEFRAASRAVCTQLMQNVAALLKDQNVDSRQIVVVMILRSGVAFLESAIQEFPNALVGVVGLKRDEHTFIPQWYYENLPPLSAQSIVVIVDPMLATGGSAEAAVTRLIERGATASNIYFVGIIAAPEGSARLAQHIPQANITLAAVDEGLDARSMIVPGLGDFGDRYFGE